MNATTLALVLLFYGLSALMHFGGLIFPRPLFQKVGLRFAAGGFLIHSVGLVRLFAAQGYPFLIHPADAFYFISWFTVLAFILLCLFSQMTGGGPFFIVTSLVFLILSIVESGEVRPLNVVFSSPWSALHLFFTFLAISVLLVSVVTGLIFYLQEFQIKMRRWGPIFAKLPALEVMDRIHARSLVIGFVLLSFSILFGSAWSYHLRGRFFSGDARQWWAVGSWCLYLVLLYFRMMVGWRGRRGVFLSLVGFAALLFTFLGAHHQLVP